MNLKFEEVTLHPEHALAIRETVSPDEFSRFFGAAFAELAQVVREAGTQFCGPPLARYHTAPPHPVDVEALMPVTNVVPPHGRVQPVELSGGRAVQVHFTGPYERLGPVYQALAAWMKEHHVVPKESPREIYLTDPQVVSDPNRWETLVVWPISADSGAPG